VKINFTYGTLLVVFFFAGATSSYFVFKSSPHLLQEPHEIFDVANDTFSLVNPLLSCGDFEFPSPKVTAKLKVDVEEYLQQSTKRGDIVRGAVYYRDLNSGPWFGINFMEQFTPGSLLKVPLLMSYYRQAEMRPSILEEKLTLTEDIHVEQLVPPEDPIVVGGSYTIAELLEKMIADSDNNAAVLLFNAGDQKLFNSTFIDLGLTPPAPGADYSVDVRTYSSFFRILYNATFLSPESSQRALEMLTKAKFKEGLVAGVPENIPMAHKFGERELDSAASLKQLHDCGIVYMPKDPYLLCVMTQGRDLDVLGKTVARISKMVFDAQAK